jgi:photosystem II stability/assembly factor-like uncharacterized protein
MTIDAPTSVAADADTVNALAASPWFERDGVCFAARNSGLYRSDDGGRSWRPAYDWLALDAPLATTAVAVSPAFEHDHTVFAGANGGVLRSLDGGATWRAAMLPEPPPLVTALAVSPSFADDGIVFAGTLEDGVFRSADRGGSWAAWNFGLLDLQVLCLAPSPDFARDEAIFAGTASGLFRSANGGRAWREVELPSEFTTVLSIAVSPAGAVLLGTEADGLFCSDDRGRAWRRLGEDALRGALNAVVAAPGFPSAPELLVLLNDTLLASRDAGVSWSSWPAEGEAAAGIAAVAAPHGLGPSAPLLLGWIDGRAKVGSC